MGKALTIGNRKNDSNKSLFLKGKWAHFPHLGPLPISGPTFYFRIVQICQYLNEVNMHRLTIKKQNK